MIDSDQPHPELTPIQREAHAWIRRLTSGGASAADAAALRQWCSQSPAHAAAFSEASQFWNAFGPAGQSLRDDRRRQTDRSGGSVTRRRALVAGALAASAAGVMIVRPPLNLWPSFSELRADYRTGTGEQQEIAVADGVSVRMDSQTSLSIARGAEPDGIELISGQASFNMPLSGTKSFSVTARGGRTSAVRAQFDVRLIGSAVCVTCLADHVAVELRGQRVALQARQQVSYGDNGLADILSIDPTIVSAWQHGLIIFNMTPLTEVIEELNRYRAGRIVLLNSELGRTPVNGRFRIDQPDEALVQLDRAFGIHRRNLPGGIVLLS